MTTNQWSILSSIGAAWQGCIQYGGSIYGGWAGTNDVGDPCNYFYRYDIDDDEWVELTGPALTYGYGYHHNQWSYVVWEGGMAAQNGKIYVMGGHTGTTAWPRIYDIDTDTWTDDGATDSYGNSYYWGGAFSPGVMAVYGNLLYCKSGFIYDIILDYFYQEEVDHAWKPSISWEPSFTSGSRVTCRSWDARIWYLGDDSETWYYYDLASNAASAAQFTVTQLQSKTVQFIIEGFAYTTTNDSNLYEFDITAQAYTAKICPNSPAARLTAQWAMYDGDVYCRANAADSNGYYALYMYDVGIDPLVADWTFFATKDHGTLEGLADDDHTQYLTSVRHAASAHTLGDVVPHDDHGLLSGLTDDDHTQYLTSVRHAAIIHIGVEPIVVRGAASPPEFVITADGDIICGRKALS